MCLRVEMELSDKEIIEGCKNNDRKCQQLLYDRYSSVLFGVCLKNSKCKEDAEDIFQDAFVKLYANLGKFSYLGSFEGWLRTFFTRVAWNYYRDRKDKYFRIELNETNAPTHENIVLEDYSNEQLINCLQRLDDKERIILVSFVIENHSWEEIAKNMNLEVATVRSMCSRAKKKLLQMFYNMEKE